MTWVTLGACRTAEPDLFFMETDEAQYRAKEYCARCPVSFDCLEHAILNREAFGVWGGTTPLERKSMFAPKRRAA